MKFKDYLYNNPSKNWIVSMEILRFLYPSIYSEFSFEHYQNLRIMESE